ncbi:unnamed protein product [Prunus armeniaca]|uniref:Uncharacterized protein n=1 Tax=Prunus armeniaca TaxID=36596 RepID=A0A6J5XGH1_PRUAR|nr:unnamed protein product [Prunus armeniaca]CAB4311035.1 unnamed protein product [Prunus armeniaca]
MPWKLSKLSQGSLTKEATLMNESRSNSGLELNQELFMLRQRSGGSSFGRLLEIVCPLLSVELLRYPLLSSLVSIVLLAPLWTAIRKESASDGNSKSYCPSEPSIIRLASQKVFALPRPH